MSSSAPLQTRELEGALSRFGIGIIDAPVSGGVKRATDGTLAIMVGGNSSSVERAHPILRTFGQSVLTIGALGAGHAMKALNNYVSAAGLVAVCEAVVVGQSFGLDPQVIVDVLNVSSGRNNSTDTKMKPFVLFPGRLPRDFLWLSWQRTSIRLPNCLATSMPTQKGFCRRRVFRPKLRDRWLPAPTIRQS